MLLNVLIFIYILMTLALVAIILAQPGKGFGLESSQSGASKTVFGSSGPRMIQRKATMILFAVWVCFNILLGGVISRSRNINTVEAIEEERATTLLFDSEFDGDKELPEKIDSKVEDIDSKDHEKK